MALAPVPKIVEAAFLGHQQTRARAVPAPVGAPPAGGAWAGPGDEDPDGPLRGRGTDPNAGADPRPNAPDGNAVVVAPQDGDDGDGADAGVDAGAVVFGATQEQWVDHHPDRAASTSSSATRDVHEQAYTYEGATCGRSCCAYACATCRGHRPDDERGQEIVRLLLQLVRDHRKSAIKDARGARVRPGPRARAEAFECAASTCK